MPDVKVVPDNKFNLFSITKKLISGWKLGGDTNSTWLSKGNNNVVFDLKIKTKEGSIYAMYMHREGRKSMQFKLRLARRSILRRLINIEKVHQLLDFYYWSSGQPQLELH
jgi:hypothetical protein